VGVKKVYSEPMEHPTCPRQSGGIIRPTMPNVEIEKNEFTLALKEKRQYKVKTKNKEIKKNKKGKKKERKSQRWRERV